ncbi:Retinal-binding protein [Araneus ventricosus]|uniref:Retinal-binding protein n=1 Tax=Araneus ventricosus TaxID=182803 RepID=A0A4Y2R3T7_ARAVE|nr:Retinal-binding protein [Araneus ventricosus]
METSSSLSRILKEESLAKQSSYQANNVAECRQALIRNFSIVSIYDWQEALLDIIDADELPAFLGGNKTDPDGNPLCTTFVSSDPANNQNLKFNPLCTTFVSSDPATNQNLKFNPLCTTFVVHAQIVPKRYYLKKSEKRLSQARGVRKMTLYPFSKQTLTFEIKETNSFLEWEFETKSRDIGFGVYFKENSQSENASVELVPKQRIDTCYEPETGIYKCEKPGTYIISFDNSYSWIYPKDIFHRIRILPPKEF